MSHPWEIKASSLAEGKLRSEKRKPWKELPNHSVVTPRRKLSFSEGVEQPSVPKTEKPNKRSAKPKDAADDDDDNKESKTMIRLRAKTRLELEEPNNDDEAKGGQVKAEKVRKPKIERASTTPIKESKAHPQKSGVEAGEENHEDHEDGEPGEFSAASTGPKENKPEKERKRKKGDEDDEDKTIAKTSTRTTKKTKEDVAKGKINQAEETKATKPDQESKRKNKDNKNKDSKTDKDDKDSKRKNKDNKNKDSKTDKDEKDNKDDKVDIKRKKGAGDKPAKGKKPKTDESEPSATDVPAILRRDTDEIEHAAKEAKNKEKERLAYKARKERFYRSLSSLGPRDLIPKQKTYICTHTVY